MSSGCEASGVRDEIARDYAALQSRLRREFSDRHPGKATVIRGYSFLSSFLNFYQRLFIFNKINLVIHKLVQLQPVFKTGVLFPTGRHRGVI